MLNQDTKRKIDSARQILVGKVPDPKSQVDQITTALIYKFMDDMDKEAQKLGGKASFFTNNYEKYAWTKLMDPKIGGHDRLDLYVEAITSLSQNPHIPQLFRDIFKDAFLPYRNAETLNLFLKEVNGFSYEHSEDLGDAFEYLLNVLGTQGDAGQFRTPRHIIDFIVAAVDPKKDETICDPACGTAGFLISAYKHILKQHEIPLNPPLTKGENNSSDSPLERGQGCVTKPLTPDEKKQLMKNFSGYDISPDMVRLSKVNLYLHGFPNPTIHEYDALSSEEKWGDNFDVMLANPPFMSPKGGIRPHKRFSVQANRSEVLFVDYILEHLRPNGRAGIIVPEGIIFQSANAYKALRKLLIEDGLLAVVSLPAGVFNPYAGVKTSILLFDNGLAKKTKEILFLKIQNDGYDLGAQRREHDKNDLPLALEIIKKYKRYLQNLPQSPFDKGGSDKVAGGFILSENEKQLAHLVAKDKLAETGDYNLSGDRYIEAVNFANQKWSMVELGKVCEIEKGTSITKAKITHGDIPVIAGGQQPAYYHNQSNREGQVITVSASGAYAGFINFFEIPIFASDCTTIKPKDENKLLTKFVFRFLKSRQQEVYKLQKGMGQPHVYGKELAKIKIPLPPLEVQKEIVEQIEVKQKAIEAAKAVIENLMRERRYFGQSLRKLKGVEWVELGDNNFVQIIDGDRGKNYPKKTEFQRSGYCLFLNTSNVRYGYFDFENCDFVSKERDEKLGKGKAQRFDLVLTTRGTLGNSALNDQTVAQKHMRINSGMVLLRSNQTKLRPDFLLKIIVSEIFTDQVKKLLSGSAQPQLPIHVLSKIKIPLPPLETQKQLVAGIEEQEKIIEANKKLIGIMDQKIAEVLKNI